MKMWHVSVGVAAIVVVLGLAVGIPQCTTPKYMKVAATYPPAKKGVLSEDEQRLYAELQRCASMPVACQYFDRFFKCAYVVIEGYDSLCFTYERTADTAVIHVGLPSGLEPDLVVELNEGNCYNLPKIFEDGEVSDEEEYRIFRVTLLPSIRSELQSDALYDPMLSRMLNLPNFMQLTLTNENGYVYQNTTAEFTLTIVNVDGQWLAFEGAAGDPDVRMAFSHKQAAEFRELTFGLASETDQGQRKKNLVKVLKFLDAVTVYRRG
jgi:hypothetical protein